MTPVQAPDSNAYDVLGVAPGDSAEQIDDAFHRLIEEGGYRAGVPLRGQWLRARQIKEAYAILGDPGKRRAYDETLKEASERPLWPPVSENDPADAELIRPLSEWQPPTEPRSRTATNAPDSDNDRLSGLAAIGESDPGQLAPAIDLGSASPEDAFGRTGVGKDPAKLVGIAGAATLALGTLFYLTWPSGQLQLPATDTAAQLPAAGPQGLPGAPADQPAADVATAVASDELFGEVRPWGAGEAPPATATVSAEPAGATDAAVPAGSPTTLAAASETQASPGEAVASGEGSVPMTPSEAPASASEAPALAEAAAPMAAPAPAAAPAAVAPPAIPTARSGTRAVQSPAQWISGGPTRADNPRGRYVGSVVVQFTVQADGRVSNCGPARSSGDAGLDAFTCRLVEKSMRFKPAFDAQGSPVASTAHARYEWGRRRRHPSLLSWMFR